MSVIELALGLSSLQLTHWLNEYLLYRTFAVGNHVTLADIVCYTHSYATLMGLVDTEKFKFINVYRWANHIQRLPGLGDHIEHKIDLPDKRTARILKKADAVINEIAAGESVKEAAPAEEEKKGAGKRGKGAQQGGQKGGGLINSERRAQPEGPEECQNVQVQSQVGQGHQDAG